MVWLMLAVFALIALLLYFTKLPLYLLYTVIPFAAVLLIGIPVGEAWQIYAQGAAAQLSVAAFIFVTTAFFSLLSETGLFRTVAMAMLPKGKVSVFRLCCCAFFAGVAVSLCGQPSIVYIVVVGAFLPCFERMGADKKYLGLSAALSMGVGIAWPWSSKTLLLAGIAGTDGYHIFMRTLPLLLISVVLCVICLVFACRKNKSTFLTEKTTQQGKEKTTAVYGILFVAAIVCLMWFREYAVPVIAVETAVLAVMIWQNRPDRAACFRRMAKRSIVLTLNMAAIGAFNHLLEGTGILAAIAEAAAMLMSEQLIALLPAAFAALSCVVLLILPYQSIYAILPVMVALAGAHGIPAIEVVLPFVLAFPATVLPSLPSVGVLDEMLGQPPRTHFRRAWLPVTVVHLAVVALGMLLIF